jgi:hypothetical protein
MSLPLIIGTTVAGGVLLGLMFVKRKTIRRSAFPSVHEKRARNEIKNMAEQRKIGQSIMRQHSQHSDISDDVFKSNSDSPKDEPLRESLVGRDNVARGIKGKRRKTKRRTRRHR